MGCLQVEASGREIYFEHFKGSKTAVMLIHGWGMSCRVWDNVTRTLVEAGHEVITFDQRGCGRSDKDFEDVSIGASVGDALKLLEALKVEAVVVNGWSLGGVIAVDTADQLGARCKGVVLTCAASPRYEQAADFPYGVPAGGVAATVEAFNQNRITFLHQLAQGICAKDPGEGVVDWLADVSKQCGPLVGTTIAELATVDQRETLKKLSVPVLNIIGGKDAIADPEVGRAAKSLLQNGRLVEFEDCGHAPFMEDFPRYSTELFHFLEELG
jgi:pimeloyl-[acyl-carrier protein] methyl ester esterase